MKRKKIAREYKERLEKLTASREPKTFREPKKKRGKNLRSILYYICNSHKMYYWGESISYRNKLSKIALNERRQI